MELWLGALLVKILTLKIKPHVSEMILGMPLYDFYCKQCSFKFETLVSSSETKTAECPECGNAHTDRLVPKFRIGGQGDLRESTMFHGCHLSHDIQTHAAEEHSHSGGCCGTSTSSETPSDAT
ncbi:MAG: zinc ribbon domain-containing protein [Xanthomonadaceae bacterium]|nr:zinc ribbon domain-containing protein [Xanthomonadaceae bacterium]